MSEEKKETTKNETKKDSPPPPRPAQEKSLNSYEERDPKVKNDKK